MINQYSFYKNNKRNERFLKGVIRFIIIDVISQILGKMLDLIYKLWSGSCVNLYKKCAQIDIHVNKKGITSNHIDKTFTMAHRVSFENG